MILACDVTPGVRSGLAWYIFTDGLRNDQTDGQMDKNDKRSDGQTDRQTEGKTDK